MSVFKINTVVPTKSENNSTEGKAVGKKEFGHFSATEYVKRIDYVAIVVDYVSVMANIAQICGAEKKSKAETYALHVARV